jgi:hypothetical protein
MMEAYRGIVATITVFAFGCAGCANQSQTAANKASTKNPGEETYRQHDLERSGQAQTGPALKKIDPSIR